MKLFKFFSQPSAETLALKELEEAQRKLLGAQSAYEYAESMCMYYDSKIKRLTTYLRRSAEAK